MRARALGLFALGLFPLANVLFAEPDIEFSGLFVTASATRFSLLDKSTGTSRWVVTGDSFTGFTVASYNPKNESLLLTKAGVELRLQLQPGKVKEGPPEPSAETKAAILDNLRQIEASADQYYLEHDRTTTTLAELVGPEPEKYMKALTAVDGEDYTKLQLSHDNHVFSVTTAGGAIVTFDSNETGLYRIVSAGDTLARIAQTSGISVQQLVQLNTGMDPSKSKIGQRLRTK